VVKSIKIPATPRSAYQPNRKVSNLLKAHIANLEAVTQRKYGGAATRRPKTEGQASAYIAELTKQLHVKTPVRPTAYVQPVAYTPPPAAPAAAAAPPARVAKKATRRPSKTKRASRTARRAGSKK
jgi:hypothetical protein